MTEVVRNLSELESRLDALPPPADGFVRVYRGQTTNYPAMLPSACRPGAPPTTKIWDIALLGLRGATPEIDTGDSDMEMIENLGFWFKVLAQHYGPGSPYLDVTTSPAVALWFALNAARLHGAEHGFRLTQLGLLEVPVRCTALTYSMHTDDPGWFYVLDVPRWNERGTPGHGELLDLKKAPDFVTRCPRVRSQHGLLIQADADKDGGDLSGLCACAPVPVARPFAGVPFIDASAGEVYPPPDVDRWYETFLRAPLIPLPDEDSGFAYRQSLGVYVVAPHGRDEELLSALERQIERAPTLVRGRLRADPALRRSLRDATGVDPETATYLQLEIPLLVSLPPAEHWSQCALATGIGGRVQPRVEGTGEKLPAVPLDNFLLQLSPLEHGFADADTEFERVEAAWLVRERDTLHFTVFGTSQPDGEPIRSGPWQITFSKPAGRFEVIENDRRTPLLDFGLPASVVKAFLITLEIVRGLTSGPKPDASPQLAMALGEERVTMVCIRGVSTILTRAKRDPADLRLHFLRYANSREPYAGPRHEMPCIAMVKLVSRTPYAEMRCLREIYGHVHDVLEGGIGIPMPGRGDEDLSPQMAKYLLERYAPDEQDDGDQR